MGQEGPGEGGRRAGPGLGATDTGPGEDQTHKISLRVFTQSQDVLRAPQSLMHTAHYVSDDVIITIVTSNIAHSLSVMHTGTHTRV